MVEAPLRPLHLQRKTRHPSQKGQAPGRNPLESPAKNKGQESFENWRKFRGLRVIAGHLMVGCVRNMSIVGCGWVLADEAR